jgi:hypothetical protein
MLDTSKIANIEVRHNSIIREINKKYLIDKIYFLLNCGLQLLKYDIIDVPENLEDEDTDYIHYRVIERQIWIHSNKINIIYYIDDLE